VIAREGDSSSADPVDAKEVGQRLARARKDAGMTQKELGNLVGVTQRSVANWESGKVVPYRHLRVIEAAVGRPAASLLYSDEARMEVNAVIDELYELRDLLRQAVRKSAAFARQGGGGSFLESLERLVELRYQEMITEEEFAAAKALLLGLDANVPALRVVPDEHTSPPHAAE